MIEDKHLMRFRLPEYDMRVLLTTGGMFRTIIGMPSTAIFHGVYGNWAARSIEIMAEHPSFPAIPAGGEAPATNAALEVLEHPYDKQWDGFARVIGNGQDNRAVYILRGPESEVVYQLKQVVDAAHAYQEAVQSVNGIAAAEKALFVALAQATGWMQQPTGSQHPTDRMPTGSLSCPGREKAA